MKTVNRQSSVRVNSLAKKKLKEIQAQTDRSQTALLDRAIDLLEREVLAQQMAADFADLESDSEELRKYQKLSAIFDGAVGDGLTKK